MKTNVMNILKLTETEYEACIRQYFEKEFPSSFKPTKASLLEIVSEIFLGTKEVRYGPIPLPENLVVIRDVIRQAMDNDIPIPILVPFGGIKANKTSQIDVAEVSAIKRLTALDECVKKFYPPGIQVTIRLEDLGAVWLYDCALEPTIREYTLNMQKLVYVLAKSHRIHAVSEWALMGDKANYFSLSDRYSNLILSYLYESEGMENRLGKGKHFEILEAMGWKGVIPFEQREHYIQGYLRQDPALTRNDALKKLADYLGGAKARYDLKGTAGPKTRIGKYIQISFVQPVPGSPLSQHTLYYRTLPFSEARSHIPAWRGKGYLKIDPRGKATAKITNWHDKELLNNLTPSTITIGDPSLQVDVRTDYILI